MQPASRAAALGAPWLPPGAAVGCPRLGALRLPYQRYACKAVPLPAATAVAPAVAPPECVSGECCDPASAASSSSCLAALASSPCPLCQPYR
eukprot:6148507-Pleurochrysis_carterae.AAC.1